MSQAGNHQHTRTKHTWGFPKIRGTFLRAPIIRTIVFVGSTLGSLYFGKLPLVSDFGQYACSASHLMPPARRNQKQVSRSQFRFPYRHALPTRWKKTTRHAEIMIHQQSHWEDILARELLCNNQGPCLARLHPKPVQPSTAPAGRPQTGQRQLHS